MRKELTNQLTLKNFQIIIRGLLNVFHNVSFFCMISVFDKDKKKPFKILNLRINSLT